MFDNQSYVASEYPHLYLQVDYHTWALLDPLSAMYHPHLATTLISSLQQNTPIPIEDSFKGIVWQVHAIT